MADLLDKDEIELDKFIMDSYKMNIIVPDKLENKIRDRINKTKIRRNSINRIFVASAAVILLMFGMTLFAKDFMYIYNTVSSRMGNIIGLNYMKDDLGTENAKKNGYMGDVQVKVKEDGYEGSISSIELDEQRLVFTGMISGIDVKAINGKNPADIEIVPLDFSQGAIAGGGGSVHFNNDGTATFRYDELYKEGEVEKFLNKKQGYIKLKIMIFKRKAGDINGNTASSDNWHDIRDYSMYQKGVDTVIKEFKNINIPIDYSKVQKSIDIEINKEIDNTLFMQYGMNKIMLNKLIISPTMMRLQIQTYEDKDKFPMLKAIINGRLEDDKGNIYKDKGIDGITGCDTYIANTSNDIRKLEFLPSVYFDKDKVVSLYFCFDGIKIDTTEQGKGVEKVINTKQKIEIKFK